jgi:hypothetical protein
MTGRIELKLFMNCTHCDRRSRRATERRRTCTVEWQARYVTSRRRTNIIHLNTSPATNPHFQPSALRNGPLFTCIAVARHRKPTTRLFLPAPPPSTLRARCAFPHWCPDPESRLYTDANAYRATNPKRFALGRVHSIRSTTTMPTVPRPRRSDCPRQRRHW